MTALTADELAQLRMLKRMGHGNTALGLRFGRTATDIDIALNALLGRTPAEAAATLNEREAA